MATERLVGTASPVIIMSEEEEYAAPGSGAQSGPWWPGVAAARQPPSADADHASGLPRLVVPGLTPRSSTSSQSCLSVPGIADVNGYTSITSFYSGLDRICRVADSVSKLTYHHVSSWKSLNRNN